MTETITVYTGEIKMASGDANLKSSPLGSCVVVVLFDEIIKAGVMAHIMLPGKAPQNKIVEKCRYAVDAIGELLVLCEKKGMDCQKLKAVVVGGGNVLKRPGDSIGLDNLNSVLNQLKINNIPVLAKSVGGTNRKSVWFDIGNQRIYYTEGDSKEKFLYELKPKRQ